MVSRTWRRYFTVEIARKRDDVQVLAFSLLYDCPILCIIWPRIMKFAAMRGVGEIIVVVILTQGMCEHA